MNKRYLVTGGSGFIGTNLVEKLIDNKLKFINIDINEPKIKNHFVHWVQCDILDIQKVNNIFKEFSPTNVLHLAARTDVEGKTLEDYKVNTKGTQNILEVLKATKSVERIIITSTQFVNQNNGTPKNDEDFAPHTVYGESKVITEKLTREANLECIWSIIRPTNVWGPWHPRYPREFWRIIGEGKYIHPNKKDVIRSYGYVKTVIDQILQISVADSIIVDKQVFYVGDSPINLINWVNGFSKMQIGRNVVKVPRQLIFLLAVMGDLVKKLGYNFPITISRYKSMTSSNPAPMDKTIKTFGDPLYKLEDGIRETVEWLKIYYPDLVKT